MRRARCPYCNNANPIAEEDWGEIVRCEAPRCGRIYQTGGGDPVGQVEPVSPPFPRRRAGQGSQSSPSSIPIPKPLLTGPHVCHACQGEIGQGLGKRRATIVHRLPAQGDRPAGAPCRMDVYAAVYYCPNMHCQVVLETPSYQWGRTVTCPACETEFVAPYDDILHEHEGDVREGQILRFRCPSCEAPLHCDSTRQGQPTTGLRVACRRCLNVIEIPAGGAGVGVSLTASHDVLEVLHQGAMRRCVNPTCSQWIPHRANRCPFCAEEQML